MPARRWPMRSRSSPGRPPPSAMESIDVHFHVVPPAFLEAVRRGTFRQVMELQRRGGREFTVYHAPDDVVVEPDNEVDPRLSDERLILEGLDRRQIGRAHV